jgi:hypothetical protein
MLPQKRKTIIKVVINAITNVIVKVITKVIVIATRFIKVKATRARNNAIATRILQSLTPLVTSPLVIDLSRIIGSNLIIKLVTARARKAKEVVNKRHNHELILFVIKGYLDSRKPCIKHSLVIDFNNLYKLR